MSFSEKELAYLKSQPLARIGTSSKSGRPDVAAVSFDTDGEYVYVSGRDVMNTMKYNRAGLRYKEKRTSSSIPDTWDPEPISGSSLS